MLRAQHFQAGPKRVQAGGRDDMLRCMSDRIGSYCSVNIKTFTCIDDRRTCISDIVFYSCWRGANKSKTKPLADPPTPVLLFPSINAFLPTPYG